MKNTDNFEDLMRIAAPNSRGAAVGSGNSVGAYGHNATYADQITDYTSDHTSDHTSDYNMNRDRDHRNAGDDDEPADADTESDVLTAPAEPKLKRPQMYKVLILNDDYTPMEFVVHILESFFVLSREKATQIMLSIHTTGSGVAGIFPRDIAETKSEQVNQYAQENNHPLMSTVEMTD